MRENERVTLYRDDGIVLRTQKLGEADRIITLLTRRTGRVRAVAKGVPQDQVEVRRAAGAVHPRRPAVLRAALARPRSPRPRRSRPYGEALVTDYPRYTAGTAMLETAERFTDRESEPALQQFLLLVGGLRTLAERRARARGSSWTPSCCARSRSTATRPRFDDCARCGAPRPNRRVRGRGGRRGLRRRAGRPARVPAAATLALMLALLSGDWETADAASRATAVRAAAWWPPICSGIWSAACARCGYVEK